MSWTLLESINLLKSKDKALCRCHCGAIRKVNVGNLKSGKTTSCGCSRKLESTKEDHRLYSTWKSMKSRCYNPNTKSYPYYGGKGVGVCERWRRSFDNFLEDMEGGFKEGLTLDRIDSSKNYCKENCRWANSVTQSNNQDREYTKILYNGVYYTEAEISRLLNISRSTLQSRRLRGWSDDEIIKGKDSKTTYYVDGIKFNQKSLANYLGISPQLLNKRLKSGLTLEEVLNEFRTI